MRHNIDIFISNIGRIASEAINYVADGSPATLPFIHAYSLLKNSNSEGEIFVESYKFLTESIQENGGRRWVAAQKETSVTGNVQKIKGLIEKIYRDNLTIANPGDSNCMILNVVVPGYDKDAQELCALLSQAAKESEYRFDYNVIVLRESIMRDVLHQEDAIDNAESSQWIDKLVADKTERDLVRHIIPFANQNAAGISVNFSEESLSRLLGEYILLCTECYGQLFPSAMDTTRETPIVALGLSTLFFNRHYFVDYLRNSAILRAIEKEGAGNQNVDVNVASNEAQQYLKEQKKKLDAFWDKEVHPLIIAGLSHEKIAAQIVDKIKEIFNSMMQDIDEIVYSPRYSLTEKQAILAQIISEDDDLIRGTLYRKDQIAMECFENEPLNFFISEDNSVKPSVEDKKKAQEDGLPLKDPSILKAPLNKHGMVYNPVPDLLQLRQEITTTTADIRRAEDEIEQLNKQVKEDLQRGKVLTERGFVYGGQEYKLSNFTDKPLEETYNAQPVTIKEVDLRDFFTPIKAQGNLGACTSFAMASIFEYIMKKHSQIDENLSEQYLYYHCRRKHNEINIDIGSSLYDAIHVLNERGICSELLCPYEPARYTDAPSEEAEKDAAERRLVKAMNVARNINDIKSAVAEGYPVAISLRVPQGFGSEPGGFVEYPSEEVIADINGSHAMVICGYSDESKFFIVRNSWGTSFGDNGYCYIPYNYIADTRLLNAAYIVTETSMGTSVKGIKGKTKVSFGSTDATIQRAIKINILNEDRLKLMSLMEKYRNLMKEHYQLVQQLKSGIVRQNMFENSKVEIDKNINYLYGQIRKKQNERQDALNILSKDTNHKCLLTLGIAFLGAIESILALKYEWSWPYLGFIIAGVSILVITLMYSTYSFKKKDTRREYDNSINQLGGQKYKYEQHHDELQLKMHIYGEFLIMISDYQLKLRQTYNRVCSLNRNLVEWGNELSARLQDMHPDAQAPFIPILNNKRLDEYFADKANDILKDVMLCNLIKDYTLSDESLKELKKSLEETINAQLEKQTEGFSIMEFLYAPESFPYLIANNVENLIPLMENQAMPFLHYSVDVQNPSRPSMTVFVCGNDKIMGWWHETSIQYFTLTPAAVKVQDPNKLIVLRLKQIQKL